MPIDHAAARALLDEVFAEAEQYVLQGQVPTIDPNLVQAFDSIFSSRTQAYREVLVGCVIARLQDKGINLRLPYINQGPEAFNSVSA